MFCRNRVSLRSLALQLTSVAALPVASAFAEAPVSDLPDVGTLERVERAPPGSLPARRERAVTLAEAALETPGGVAAMRVFEAMDDDRNGRIDAAEQARAQALVNFDFTAVDANRDGRVDRDEYQAWRQADRRAGH